MDKVEIRCGSLSLRPVCSFPQLPTPPRGDAVEFRFRREQSNSTGGTLTHVSVSFTGAASRVKSGCAGSLAQKNRSYPNLPGPIGSYRNPKIFCGSGSLCFLCFLL